MRLILFIVLLAAQAASAQGPMGANDIVTTLGVANSINYLRKCFLKKPLFEDLGFKNVKNLDGSLTPVSILTKEQLQKVFTLLATRKDIPFRYPIDGCYARALKMNLILDELGIQSGKIFIEGELHVNTPNTKEGYVKWDWHVAPFVFVRSGDKIVKQVIDPSIFTMPVSVSQWTGIQTSNNQKECTGAVYFTTPYTYFPTKKDLEEPADYFPGEIPHMNFVLKEYLKRQK